MANCMEYTFLARFFAVRAGTDEEKYKGLLQFSIRSYASFHLANVKTFLKK